MQCTTSRFFLAYVLQGLCDLFFTLLLFAKQSLCNAQPAAFSSPSVLQGLCDLLSFFLAFCIQPLFLAFCFAGLV
jgi:hypothetical protein